MNGIHASTYVAFLDDANVNIVDQHSMAHMFFSMHRLMCHINFDMCLNESYNEEGFSTYVNWMLQFDMWANATFGPTIQTLGGFIASCIFTIWVTLEQMLMTPILTLLMIVYVVYKAKKTKNSVALKQHLLGMKYF